MFDQVEDASKIVLNKLDDWVTGAIHMFPNFLIAILVFILFVFAARILRGVLTNTLPRMMNNQSVVKLIVTIVSFFVIAIGLFVALGVLNLDKTVTSLLAGVGIIGLALGFAFQDAAANLISGIFMAVKSPINVGDIMEYDKYFGTVKKIGLRDTTIYLPEGQDVIIPNRLIFQNPYTHYTIHQKRRIDLKCGVSYGDDLAKVEKVVKEVISGIKYLKEGENVDFFYEEFDSSSINFVVRYWITFKRPVEFFKARHDGIMLIKKAFDENDITIPFPIRTLDFGIKGGEKLSEMLNNSENK